ncbi:MAG: hypothetical protein AB8B85_00540 [Paracoccaceae bacterium]
MSELVGQAGLTGIVLIDIGIGVIFAILTFSLIASALQEAIAGVLNYRGEHLRKGIVRLVADEDFGHDLLEHPAIRGLKGPKNRVQKILQWAFIWGKGAREKDRLPSSIPKGTFARALVETLVERKKELEARMHGAAATADTALQTAEQIIDGLAMEHRLRDRLKQIVAQVDFSALAADATATIDGAIDETKRKTSEAIYALIADVEQQLARWFDEAMDRVTGWYVRRAKTMLFAIGFVMAAGLGFDLIGYGKQLARDDALRSAIVAEAEAAVASGSVGLFAIDAPKVNQLLLSARAKQAASTLLTPEEEHALAAFEEFNTDGNQTIDEADIAAADEKLRLAVGLVREQAERAIGTVQSKFGDKSITLNRSLWDENNTVLDIGQLLLSWLLLGVGCTLGGQFWFDLLKTFLNVRAGATGLTTDRERPQN